MIIVKHPMRWLVTVGRSWTVRPASITGGAMWSKRAELEQNLRSWLCPVCTGRETGDLQHCSKRPSRMETTIKWQGVMWGYQSRQIQNMAIPASLPLLWWRTLPQQPGRERVHWAEITGHNTSPVWSSVKNLGHHVHGQEQREKQLVDPCCLLSLRLHTPEHKGPPTFRMRLLPQIMKQSLTENDTHQHDLDNASGLALSGGSRSWKAGD